MELRLNQIAPSQENLSVYAPRSDEDIRKLAESIREHGLKQRIVVTRNGVIVSGHSRYRACSLLGLDTVKCEVDDLYSWDPRFLGRLVECNRQRVKTLAEQIREHVVHYSAEDAYESLIEYREHKAFDWDDEGRLDLGSILKEPKLSDAKMDMVRAVQKVVASLKEYWPLSVRTIHYELLNDPPLRNATAKKRPRYVNDKSSYDDLSDVCKRMRLEGYISFGSIADETRKTEVWSVEKEAGAFFEREMSGFLKNYWRDLMQGQPNHIEIVGEKNTVESSIKHVACQYTIPYTLGRGYASLDPRYKMYQRYKASGKERLIILFMTDFDPEGEDIATSFGRSMRDHFSVDVVGVKVCLTAEQVKEFNLPPMAKAKSGSSRHKGFVDKHGDNVWELEALPTAERVRLLREAIDRVIDVDAFNAQLDREKKDAADLTKLREQVAPMLRELLPQ
ncbi:MAG: hypothetical protein BGO49_21455 [Planctomycetales bacterium 71-10]|nr:MAG: hypothetical protein BGO49_21455 [Planctomycetales bacterium 71-10]